jgi:threonine dehydratase
VLPAVYKSWISGNLESTPPAKTIADGLATRQAFELPVRILRQLADDFILVEETGIRNAIKLYAEKAHTIAEGAGAAPLAAAIKLRDQLRGKKIGIILLSLIGLDPSDHPIFHINLKQTLASTMTVTDSHDRLFSIA